MVLERESVLSRSMNIWSRPFNVHSNIKKDYPFHWDGEKGKWETTFQEANKEFSFEAAKKLGHCPSSG